jgi:flagellar hook-associated protein 1 FlgK
MSGLFGTLSIAVGALLAEQKAEAVTANNVANANTPGYSRQRPVFVASDPVQFGSLTLGSGVLLQKIESLRDPILELRIHDETQQQGSLDAFVSSMQQVEVGFNNASGGDIGTLMSKFFSSLQQLSTDPGNLAMRQSVITAGGNLANGFQTTTRNLQTQRTNLDLDVIQSVAQVNTLTGQIAQLNEQITELENIGKDASAFIDQRDVLINQLSELVDVSAIKSDNGLTLTTSNGTALVAGARSFVHHSGGCFRGAAHLLPRCGHHGKTYRWETGGPFAGSRPEDTGTGLTAGHLGSWLRQCGQRCAPGWI